jgi:PadR family transcriptional regulator, regulatory protein PadR
MSLSVYPDELEEFILWNIVLLEGTAYAVSLTDALQKQSARSISLSVMHGTLYQMEKKGLIQSTLGGATVERGGRRKRLFCIAPYDQDASKWQATRDLLWKRLKKTLSL